MSLMPDWCADEHNLLVLTALPTLLARGCPGCRDAAEDIAAWLHRHGLSEMEVLLGHPLIRVPEKYLIAYTTRGTSTDGRFEPTDVTVRGEGPPMPFPDSVLHPTGHNHPVAGPVVAPSKP